MLVLLSNDDGVGSRGIRHLSKAMAPLGHVVVVAPDRERSAVGHALTLHKPLRVIEVDEKTFSVNGTPTDCITLAVNRILSLKPDLVVSGINRGGNLGDNVTYSGTVSAAMEGALLGIPSIAVSVVGDGRLDYEAAAEATLDIARRVARQGLPRDTFLNVNVPNLPRDQIQGIRVTCMGRRIFKDPVIEKEDPRGRRYYWVAGEEVVVESEGYSDYDAVKDGYISVTPLHLDLTNHEVLKEMESLLTQN
ncbi:MAG: 5'/3'-nucleotidase SurE [bacterium]|nr:5'/3'-nucleotidase SurE [bacterium]